MKSAPNSIHVSGAQAKHPPCRARAEHARKFIFWLTKAGACSSWAGHVDRQGMILGKQVELGVFWSSRKCSGRAPLLQQLNDNGYGIRQWFFDSHWYPCDILSICLVRDDPIWMEMVHPPSHPILDGHIRFSVQILIHPIVLKGMREALEAIGYAPSLSLLRRRFTGYTIF